MLRPRPHERHRSVKSYRGRYESLADLAEKALRKGTRVFVAGKLRNAEWVDPDGHEHQATEVALTVRGGELAIFSPKRRTPEAAPDRVLARTARDSGLTGGDEVMAEAQGRAMRRDRPAASEQPGSARGPGFSGSSRPRSAAGHVLPLTEDRLRSRVSGGSRAYLGNVG